MGASELWTGDNIIYRFTEPTLLNPQKGTIFYHTSLTSKSSITLETNTKAVEDILYTKKTNKNGTNESDSTLVADDVLINFTTVEIPSCKKRPSGTILETTENGKYPSHLKYALMAAALCNNSAIAFDEETQEWSAIGDPTEVALVVASEKAKMGKSYWESDKEQGYQRIFEQAFDSERKLMSVVYKRRGPINDQCLMFCKGAPEELLRQCKYYISPDEKHVPLGEEFDTKVSKESSRMASQGLRILGLAYKEVPLVSSSTLTDDTMNEPMVPTEYMEQGLIFIGLIGLIDPPKKGVKKAIQTCQEAGIRIMMITGDHVKTATAIAMQLGIFNADQPDKVYNSFVVQLPFFVIL